MSEFRFNFLNWAPDLEDTEHDGLTVADNVIHEPEGYKPTYLMSAGAFSTTGGLAASTATVLSIVTKPVGSQDDVFSAWLTGEPATIHVGINGVTATANTSAQGSLTGYPLSFSTAGTNGIIYAFDVCESYDKIFFVVEARQNNVAPNTIEAIRHIGYMDF